MKVFKTGLGLAAVGILPSEYIKQGDPSRLANGLDYHGNLCGVTNYITPRGDDVINLRKAYPLPSGLFVCVESYPDANNMYEFICGYETQQEIDELLSLQAKVGSEYSTEKSLYMFYVSQKRCLPRIESASFLGYCKYTKQTDGRSVAI